MTIGSLGTILSVWAHPDDESYLAAGVMAEARDLGQRVVCVTATLGERGTADPERWPPHRLRAVRHREAVAATAALGVTDHRVLGFPDGELADHDEAGRRAMAALFDEVAPDTVLTFGADGMTFHPDHQAVHRWAVEAWADRGHRARLLLAASTSDHLAEFGPLYEDWAVYMTDERPDGVRPDDLALHLQLDGPALERKLAALRAHDSQTADVVAALGVATYRRLVAEEAFVAADVGVIFRAEAESRS